METSIETTEIWNLYHQEIRHFIRSKVNDADLAEDILQDTFVTVHTKKSSLYDQSKLKAWIYQISRNLVNMHFRKLNQVYLPIETPVLETVESNENVRIVECMKSFLQKMPRKYREAVEDVELYDLNQLQLAEKLNISYSGAKSRLQRGKKLLKKKLDACCSLIHDKYGNIITAEPRENCACGSCF